MIIRRLRGLFATTVGGALVGGVVGTVVGLLFLLTFGPKTPGITPQFPGSVLIVPAAVFAVVGAASGVVFGGLLMMAERGRGIEDLRASRVALWAAVAAVATFAAQRVVGTASWFVITVGVGLAAGIGFGATRLAKRSRDVVASSEIHPPPT
jgi:hypothetical protein